MVALVLTTVLVSPRSTQASYPIDEPSVIYTLDFSSFTGSGFAPEPAPGQLDSDTWRVSGMSDGDLEFGGTKTTGDYAKGLSAGNVGPPGIYAFQVDNGVVALGFQPSNSDFTPGEIGLRLQNNTTDMITDLQITYDLWVNNNQAYASTWSFHHSADDLNFLKEVAGDYTSGEAADGLEWQKQSFTVDVIGLALDHGAYYYFKWASDDASGHGQRDEFGLNNISITATVSEVNYPPDAVEDSDTTPEDTSITIDVIANDTDVDGDGLLLDSFSQPTNGVVSREENGTPSERSDDKLTYTPDQDWSGGDSFTYTIEDGNGEMDTANVNITVMAVNDPPDAVGDSATSPQDTSVSVNVLLNDSDPELDTLYLDSFTQPLNGSVSRDDNGTPGDTTDDQLVYTPNRGWNGRDSFTYTIIDGNGGVDSATVMLTVEAIYPYTIFLPLVIR
jgi:hypothetical protein